MFIFSLNNFKKRLLKFKEKYIRNVNRIYITNRSVLEYTIKRKELTNAGVSKRSFLIINEWEIKSKQLMKHAKKRGFRIAIKENLIKYKTSNTLFILGSGPSINDISEDQWAHISSCDSIGFNWFLVHSHVPTYYHMELSKKDVDLFKECYEEKSLDFKKIPMIFNLHHLPDVFSASDFKYIENYFVSIPRRFRHAKKQEMEEIIKYHYFFSNFKKNNILIHYRGSLIIAITLGVLLGYEKIVLAGIDMFNNDYFFFDKIMYNNHVAEIVRNMRIRENQDYLIKTTSPDSPHRTVDPLFKVFPLNQVVILFDECVLKPKNIQLTLLSKNSLLFPLLSLYKRAN